MLRVGAESVPLLAVGVAEPEGHLLLRAVQLRRLLQRRHHRPLALVGVHRLQRAEIPGSLTLMKKLSESCLDVLGIENVDDDATADVLSDHRPVVPVQGRQGLVVLGLAEGTEDVLERQQTIAE